VQKKGKHRFFIVDWSQIDQKWPLQPVKENRRVQTLKKLPNMTLSGCHFGDLSVSRRNTFFDGSAQSLCRSSRAAFKRLRVGKNSRRRGQSGPGTSFSEPKASFFPYGGTRGGFGRAVSTSCVRRESQGSILGHI